MSRRIDLAGQTFGRLTAREFTRHNGRSAWICDCSCGGTAVVNTQNLRRGLQISCGCRLAELHARQPAKRACRACGKVYRPDKHTSIYCSRDCAKGPRLKLAGRIFGRLTAIKPVKIDRRTHWLCRCECGGTTLVITSNLTRRNTLSCGCLRSDNAVLLAETYVAKTVEKTCKRCDLPFLGDACKQVFCSDHCAHRWQTERLWPPSHHACPIDGTEFFGRAERIYCSERCKRVAANVRALELQEKTVAGEIARLKHRLNLTEETNQ